jgi:AMMECR1 domain-containing protein
MATMMNGRVKDKPNDFIKVFDKKTTVFFSLEKKVGFDVNITAASGQI